MKAPEREWRASPQGLVPETSSGLSEQIAQANAIHRAGNLQAAEDLYLEILRLEPGHPDALHFLGVLRHQQKRSDEAVELIEQSIRHAPAYADAHNNLGNIHKECGRLAQAELCYRRALEIAPLGAALSNLALILEALGRHDEAFVAHHTLTERNPRFPRGWFHFGQFIVREASSEEQLAVAVTCFKNAIALAPEDSAAYSVLGNVLYALGDHAEAVAMCQRWLARDPDDPVALHRLAAFGGTEAPPRATDSYISTVFNRFADSFDELLLHDLNYRAPQILVEALARRLPVQSGSLDVLDAGCGTGLCGPLIRPWAKQLTGVDLSGGMIDKARPRKVYDVLEVAELTAYLHAHTCAYDLVLSADTLVYFGALSEVSAAMFDALRPGGCVGFTIEACDDPDDVVRLNASGRYSHSHLHVVHALQAAGFADQHIEANVLRTEGGKPVRGWVVTAGR